MCDYCSDNVCAVCGCIICDICGNCEGEGRAPDCNAWCDIENGDEEQNTYHPDKYMLDSDYVEPYCMFCGDLANCSLCKRQSEEQE